MVVYNKKVLKRRRKRSGSKRKITKPRNKRMNRSRQMGGMRGPRPELILGGPGGAGQPAPEPAPVAAPAAAGLPAAAPAPDPAAAAAPAPAGQGGVAGVPAPAGQGGRADALALAQGVGDGVQSLVEQQGQLCQLARTKINDMLARINETPDVDLSDIIGVLRQVLGIIGGVDNLCQGVNEGLERLDQQLMSNGCLRRVG